MKLLIICNDFPPLNSIGSQRPYSWFKYFQKYGIQTTVITKNWIKNVSSPYEILKNIKDQKVEEDTKYGKIIKVPHNLILPEKILLKFGVNRFNYFRKGFTFIYKFLSFYFFYFDQHKFLHNEAKAQFKKNHYDVVITTAEPNIIFRYGYLLKKKYNFKWIADFRDGWCIDHVTSLDKRLINKIIKKNEFYLERKFISKADIISSVDPILTKKLEK